MHECLFETLLNNEKEDNTDLSIYENEGNSLFKKKNAMNWI